MRRALVILGLAVVMGCPADDGTQPGTLTLSITPTSATVQQGNSTQTAATATSGGGFSGTVTFAVTGTPVGVTAAASNVMVAGNTTTGTLTMQVAASTAPGTYNLTVRAQGTGVADGTAAFTLTVTATPSYTLSVLPAALTIVQATNANTAVTITRTNFTGVVELSLGGAPAGVTGVFAPELPTGTTSTLTVSVGGAVAPGTYNLTVDGTGTAGNRSTALTLTVTPTPNYTLALAPAALTIVQGATDNSVVTITRTNFTGAVTLSVGSTPAGVTGAFLPAAPTGTTSTLTLSVGAAVPPGVYDLTVDGTGTAGNRSTPLTLTVTAPTPDYALSIAPTTLSIVQGASDNSTVTITRTNFTGAVTLSVGNAPAGVTGVFAPAAPTGTSSTLTLSVGGAVAPGTYNLTVDGTGTAGTRSTPLTLTVQPTPDYTLSLAPTTLTIGQGNSDNSTVTITRTNFTGAVTLSLGNAPAGVTGVFVPAAPTTTTSTLTVSVGGAVAAGTYNLTVDGTGTAGSRSTPLTLTVTDAPNYALSVVPTTLTIVQGSVDSTAVTIARTNFAGAVTLTLTGAPSGVSGVFAPAAPTGTAAMLVVTVGAAVAPGTYNLTVNGSGTPGSRSTPLTLTVTATPEYALSLSRTALTIVQGLNDTATVTLTRTNFTGAVTLSVGNAPAGVTGVFAPAAPTGTSSTLTLTVGGAVAPGTYNLTVDGTGTAGNRSTPLTLTVTATPNYTLSILPTALSIAPGANDNTAVTITRTNFTGGVTLSLGNAPAGVTGVFAPAAPTGTSSTLTVSVGGGVTPGIYNLTVDGSSAVGSRSTPLTLTVTGGGGSNVTVDFSGCAVAERAVWLAYQDGAGAWVRVTPAGDVYTFSIASGTGGLAYVILSGGAVSQLQVQYMTQAELTAGTLTFCAAAPVTRTMSGTLAGVGMTEQAYLALGGGTAFAFGVAPAFDIAGVSDGTHDLVGFRSDFSTPGGERALLRRDVVVTGNGSVGTVDFAGVESFVPASATMTVAGLLGGDMVTQNVYYHVGATCEAAALVPFGTAAATFSAFGIPAGQQRASDYHRVGVQALNAGTSDIRMVTESFHTMAARTLTLGAVMPTPVIGSLGGPYKRLQATFTLPLDYTSSGFTYNDTADEKFVGLFASAGYLGGTSVALALADFSGLAGWDNSWAPSPASTGEWHVNGTSALGGGICVENARQRIASRSGSF